MADHADRVPEEWRARGGVMLPVYLREAMWLSFGGTTQPNFFAEEAGPEEAHD